jgi:ketosteroid isomerase-like protein
MRNKLVVLALVGMLVLFATGLDRCRYDAEADLKALDERLEAVAQAYVDGDVDALMDKYTDRVPPVSYVSDQELKGMDAIREYWETFFADFDITSLEFDQTAHRLERNMCCTYGLWEMTAMHGGQEIEMSGRFSSLVGRSEEGWKIVHEHISIPFEMPEPPAPEGEAEGDTTTEM